MVVTIKRNENKETLDVNLSNVYGKSTLENSSTTKNTFLSKATDGENSLLPPGLIYIDSMQRNIIFQMPATYKNVKYHAFNSDQEVDEDFSEIAEEYEFHLRIPWTVYMASFTTEGHLDTVHMFFAKKQIHNLQGYLHQTPLPNFFAENNVCRSYSSGSQANNLSEMISVAHEAVWDSNFNRDTFDSFFTCMMDRRFRESFHMPLDRDLRRLIDEYRDNRSYNQLIAENYVIQFLKNYEDKSERFIDEAAYWCRAKWGDTYSPNIGNLMHYINTSNSAFDEGALTHTIWQKSLIDKANENR